MERAKLLMTPEQEQEASAAVQSSEVTVLKDRIALLTEQVAALSTKQNRQPASMLCYWCHQPGHLQRNCPAAGRCFNCGQPGHLARECQSRNAIGAPQELTRSVGSVMLFLVDLDNEVVADWTLLSCHWLSWGRDAFVCQRWFNGLAALYFTFKTAVLMHTSAVMLFIQQYTFKLIDQPLPSGTSKLSAICKR